MRKGIRLIKRLVALFLVLLLSIESFAAVVSDNDGSAFITKAEFDSLKNNFQAQIDQYNTSIDSKIDGAIAAYLAGVKIEKRTDIQSIISKDYAYIEMFNEDNPLPIENGEINGDFTVYINAMAQNTNVENIGCGVIRTNYATVTPVYKNRSWGKRVNKNFYNLCVYKGNLDITYQIVGNWQPSGGRFLGYDSSIMATNMLQGNPNWSDAECDTHWNCPWLNTGICYIIKNTDWTNGYIEYGNAGPQEYEFSYDNTNKKWNYYQVYWYKNSVSSARDYLMDQTGRSNNCFNVVAHCPTLSVGATYANMNVMWHPGAGITRAQDVSWVKENENTKTTLAGITPFTYETAIAVWPLLSYDVVPTQFAKNNVRPASINLSRSHMRRVFVKKDNAGTLYPGFWWYFDENYNQTDTQPTTVTSQRQQGMEACAGEWTSMFYLLDNNFDRKNELLFLDEEVLSIVPSDKLKSYLRNNNLSAGIPMWSIEKEGKLEVTLPFEDTTKEYNCWFTKGPMTIDTSTSLPTNTYKYDKTENADKSVTLKSTDKVTFEVNKDDIVYVSWTEKDKLGGGKIPNPLSAVFIND